jgi:hypothetical protein
MNVIQKKYKILCETPSDINEHLPTLARYASECSVVAEMGVSTVRSTWAFLQGLCETPGPKELFCVDIEDIFMGFVEYQAAEAGIKLTFLKENSAKVNFGKPVELLFIDTWHVYGHLKRELEHHHENVTKYIILHDTEGDALLGETVRFWCDYGKGGLSKELKTYVKTEADKLGYSEDEVARGLQPAIDEFLEAHPEWETHEVFTNNSGLTVLRRKNFKVQNKE